MVLVHLQPVVIVIVCHAMATDGGVGGVLDHRLGASCLDTCFGISTAWLVVWKPLLRETTALPSGPCSTQA